MILRPLKSRTQMQTPNGMDKVAVEDYYHMITINENNVNNSHLIIIGWN